MSNNTSAFVHGLRFLIAGAICAALGYSAYTGGEKKLTGVLPAGMCMAVYGATVLLLELFRAIFFTFLAADLGKNQEKE